MEIKIDVAKEGTSKTMMTLWRGDKLIQVSELTDEEKSHLSFALRNYSNKIR